jgi:hypothetical protein
VTQRQIRPDQIVGGVGSGSGATMYPQEDWYAAASGDALITLGATPIAKTLKVYKNGLLLRPGSGNDYTLTGTSVLFTTPLSAGDIVSDHYWTETENPGAGTLSASNPATYVGSLASLNYDYRYQFVLPSGIAAGDLMVVAWNNWHGWSLDTANGWLPWHYPNGNTVVGAKFITTETAGQSVSPNPGNGQGYRAAGVMQIVRGVHLTNPLFDIAVSGAALDTDINARRIMHFGCQGTGGANPAPLSRGTQRIASYDGTLGVVAADEAPSPGSYTMTANAGFSASVALRSV